MEILVLASAIFNLSCVMRMNSFHNSVYGRSMCSNDVYIKNVSALLCVSEGVLPAAALPTPLYQHGVREWGFPRSKVKRKRGGRRKIPTVTGRRERLTDPSYTRSERGVVSSNLVSVNIIKTEKETLDIGYMNIQSVGKQNKKENLIEDLILDKHLDFLFLTETWFNPAGDEASISQMTPPNPSTDSFPPCDQRLWYQYHLP